MCSSSTYAHVSRINNRYKHTVTIVSMGRVCESRRSLRKNHSVDLNQTLPNYLSCMFGSSGGLSVQCKTFIKRSYHGVMMTEIIVLFLGVT